MQTVDTGVIYSHLEMCEGMLRPDLRHHSIILSLQRLKNIANIPVTYVAVI